MALPFSDDFDRADSGSVGNGWSEYESTSGVAEITSNKLDLNEGATTQGHNASAYRSDADGDSGIQIRFDFDTTGTNAHTLQVSSRSSGTASARTHDVIEGIGWRYHKGNDEFALIDKGSGSAGSSTSEELDTVSGSTVSYTYGDHFEVEIIIKSDFSMEARMWANGGSRPASADLTSTNRTPDAGGANWSIFGWLNDASGFLVDNFEITEYSEASSFVPSVIIS